MKKFICRFDRRFYFLAPIFLGIFFTSVFSEKLNYEDYVCIKNLKNNKYVTPVWKQPHYMLTQGKLAEQYSVFQILADLDNQGKNKGELKFGDEVYFKSVVPGAIRYIGDLGKSPYLLYGMQRTLLGLANLIPSRFKVLPSDTKKNLGQAVSTDDKIYLQLVSALADDKKTNKFFRFNVDASPSKYGPEIFVSDDSKLMTALAIKWTKGLAFEKRPVLSVPLKEKSEDIKRNQIELGEELIAAVKQKQPYTEQKDKILAQGANINYQDKVLKTPLHYAVISRNDSMVNWLLSKKANPNLKDKKNGMTPLHYAVILDKPEIVEKLLEHGAESIKDNRGKKPIEWTRDENMIFTYESNRAKYKVGHPIR